jgi:hypothetical protein
VAAVVGVVDDGTAVEAVVGVTFGEEGLMLAFVAVVGLRASADRRGVPLPPWPFVATRAITIANATSSAPMMAIPLCPRGFVSVSGSGGIGTGWAESRGSGIEVGEGSGFSTTGESDDEATGREGAAATGRTVLSPAAGATSSCDLRPASLTRRVGFPSREK